MDTRQTLTIDHLVVPVNGERNLLDLARKAGIDIPTFCYHSQLSIYGACRLCLVESKAAGIVASCSTPPEPGMKVRTHTEEIRQMRRIALELILANHEQNCPTCPKSTACQLQDLTRRLGVDQVRFRPTHKPQPVDRSSVVAGAQSEQVHPVRRLRPRLRGDSGRGRDRFRLPRRGGDGHAGLRQESEGCRVRQLRPVRRGLPDRRPDARASKPKRFGRPSTTRRKTVVAQIAPAVRVALGESFGLPPGSIEIGRIVAALRAWASRPSTIRALPPT